MSRREKWIDPGGRASVKPFGSGEDRPNNYGEIAKSLLENRDHAMPALDGTRLTRAGDHRPPRAIATGGDPGLRRGRHPAQGRGR